MKIFVVTHKKVKQELLPCYHYIGVGPEGKNLGCEFTDQNGLSIASKNYSFCELTAQYWIWKNNHDDYVGLVHYRRFFYHHLKSLFKFKFYTANELEKILESYDVILPKKTWIAHFSFSRDKRLKDVQEQYNKKHYKQDLDKAIKLMKEDFPEYYPSFIKVLKKKSISTCNMIVARKDIFDKYSAFLFDFLFKLEKQSDISNYDSYQKRIYGFISEILLNVFFDKHKEYKIKYVPYCNTEAPCFRQYLTKFLGPLREFI